MLKYSNDFGYIEVSPRGAGLRRFDFKGKNIIPNYSSEKEATRWSAGAILFPFPGRLQEGRLLTFDGFTYDWPIGDVPNRVALHGLTIAEDFELSMHNGGIVAHWEYDGSKPYYPFACSLTVFYTLGESGLAMRVYVRNESGQTMPYHLGWHPYINMGPGWQLESSLLEEMTYNERRMPVALKEYEGQDWMGFVDAAFVTREPRLKWRNDFFSMELTGWENTLWQLFKMPKSPFIAIEPMTGLGHENWPWLTLGPSEEVTHELIWTLSEPIS